MKESFCSFFSQCANDDIVAIITTCTTFVSALIALIAAYIAFRSFRYQRITYKKTQFTVTSDHALTQFMMSLIYQLVTIEKTYYVTKRLMDTSDNKASIDKVYYCGLKIDLSVLNNSLFLSDKMMIVCVNNINKVISELNQLIDDIFINNQYSRLTKESSERYFSILSESIKKAYALWPINMGILGIREIEGKEIYKKYTEKEKQNRSKQSSDASLYCLTVDIKKYNNLSELKDLKEKANRALDAYNYTPLISWAYYDRSDFGLEDIRVYPVLLDFVEEYQKIKDSNLVQFNKNH